MEGTFVKKVDHVIRIAENCLPYYLKTGWEEATEAEWNAQFEEIGDPDNIVIDEEESEVAEESEEETEDEEEPEEETEESDDEEESEEEK